MITPAYSPTATERVLPRLALDFTTGVLDPRITVTRALNTATRVSSGGLIVGVNADLPRFDYDPVTLVAKGLLIEESRTNQFSYSEDFSNGTGWPFGTGTTVLANAIEAPDGNTTADKIAEDSSTGTHQRSRSFTFVSGTSYAYSVFVKAAERTRIQIGAGNPATWAAQAIFDVSNGTVVSTGAGTASIINFGNGWYRCTVAGSALASAATSVLNLLVLSGTTTSYTGVTGSGLYLWGAQLEPGAFATSYIPTTTTSVTRNADGVSMTGTNFSDWYNQPASTFQTQFINKGTGGTVIGIDAGQVVDSGNNFMAIAVTGSGASVQPTVRSSGVTQAFSTLSIAAGASNKAVFGVTTNSFIAAANAVSGALDTSCTIPSTPNQLRFGLSYIYGQGSLWLQKVNYWPQRLTNSEVQAFSKG